MTILEQIVPYVDELGLQISTDKLSSVDTVCAELSDHLPDATSEIEKDIPRAGDVKTEESLLIARVLGVWDVEKLPSSNARVL